MICRFCQLEPISLKTKTTRGHLGTHLETILDVNDLAPIPIQLSIEHSSFSISRSTTGPARLSDRRSRCMALMDFLERKDYGCSGCRISSVDSLTRFASRCVLRNINFGTIWRSTPGRLPPCWKRCGTKSSSVMRFLRVLPCMEALAIRSSRGPWRWKMKKSCLNAYWMELQNMRIVSLWWSGQLSKGGWTLKLVLWK